MSERKCGKESERDLQVENFSGKKTPPTSNTAHISNTHLKRTSLQPTKRVLPTQTDGHDFTGAESDAKPAFVENAVEEFYLPMKVFVKEDI